MLIAFICHQCSHTSFYFTTVREELKKYPDMDMEISISLGGGGAKKPKKWKIQLSSIRSRSHVHPISWLNQWMRGSRPFVGWDKNGVLQFPLEQIHTHVDHLIQRTKNG